MKIVIDNRYPWEKAILVCEECYWAEQMEIRAIFGIRDDLSEGQFREDDEQMQGIRRALGAHHQQFLTDAERDQRLRERKEKPVKGLFL